MILFIKPSGFVRIRGLMFMKISTRGRYGLKAMVDLAANTKINNCVCLKSIAKRQGISESYLEQIMMPLKKAGFVKSIRGAQGGYILNKAVSDISVGDILRTLEGSLDIADCVSGISKGNCGSADCNKCVTKNVWEKISGSLSNTANSITLEELVNEYNDIEKTEQE